MAHLAISIVSTAVVLLGLTAPVATLELGSSGVNMLPDDTDERHAFNVVLEEFSDGITTADIVVLAPDVEADSIQDAVTDLIALFSTPTTTLERSTR